MKRRQADNTVLERSLTEGDVHYSLQFDAVPELVDISRPPQGVIPQEAYVFEPAAAGQDVTIYTFDTGVNTESIVSLK